MKNDYNQVKIGRFCHGRIDSHAVHGVALQPGKQKMVYNIVHSTQTIGTKSRVVTQMLYLHVSLT